LHMWGITSLFPGNRLLPFFLTTHAIVTSHGTVCDFHGPKKSTIEVRL
jgi:hypothetical protein